MKNNDVKRIYKVGGGTPENLKDGLAVTLQKGQCKVFFDDEQKTAKEKVKEFLKNKK